MTARRKSDKKQRPVQLDRRPSEAFPPHIGTRSGHGEPDELEMRLAEANALADAYQRVQALAAAERSPDEFQRSVALYCIVTAFANARRFGRALELANSIPDAGEKAAALQYIAEVRRKPRAE